MDSIANILLIAILAMLWGIKEEIKKLNNKDK